MANTIRIKRRTTGSAGAPSSLAVGELAYNEMDDILYIGKYNNNTPVVVSLGGVGDFVTLSNINQTINGIKTFSAHPAISATILATSENSTKIATTAWVKSLGYSTTTGTVTSVTPAADTGTGTAITSTGTLSVVGTANEIETSVSGTTITVGLPNDVVIAGNLTVNGTTTTVNSTTVTVDDKNIELGAVASPTDAGADGGGITLKGTTDKTFNWVDATDSWTSSEHMNLLTGKEYKINGTTVLSNNTLGSGVTSSSLTSVGTIASGTWAATDVGVAHGGTGVSSLTTNGILYGGTTVGVTAAGTIDANGIGQILSVTTGGVPAWTDTLDGGTF